MVMLAGFLSLLCDGHGSNTEIWRLKSLGWTLAESYARSKSLGKLCKLFEFHKMGLLRLSFQYHF